jgi:hypothetical protein
MRSIALTVILIVFMFQAKSQGKADNYTFMKLYVTNNKDQMLLLGGSNEWEITGGRYNDTLSIPEFVKWMGKRMGIQIKNIRLRGLFTFHCTWRSNPTIMYY